MAKGISFTLKGDWRKMARVTDARAFEQRLNANMMKATKFNAMIVQREIRKRITGRKYAPNAPLTILIKKSRTPLIDDGDLLGAVTFQTVNEAAVFIGVLRTAHDSDGHNLANLAALLHDGGTIAVTDGMRAMFQLLADVGSGKASKASLDGRAAEIAADLGPRIKQIRPFKASTKYIVIPPRKFLSTVFEDPAVLKKIKLNWEKAYSATFKQESAAAPPGPGSMATKGATAVKTASKPKKAPANRSEAARRGWRTRRAKQAKG